MRRLEIVPHFVQAGFANEEAIFASIKAFDVVDDLALIATQITFVRQNSLAFRQAGEKSQACSGMAPVPHR